MRWSHLFVPTLRDAPADAEAASHRLLIRGGFIRQLQSGHYSLLPLGVRVRAKVAAVIREEMDAIGAQEFLLPAMHPASVWKESGRYDVMGDEMFRLTDRKGAENVLGMTHEEIFTVLFREVSSYRELPQIWYQMQTKFRDEPRPKSGLLRVREFTMKDSYSFDLDEDGLDAAFELHHDAYVRIFERLGLPAVPVVASSGAMGGSGSIEFMVASDAGEDDVVQCDSCGYAANVERATSALPAIDDSPGPSAPERFATPDVRTIAGLAEFEPAASPERQIKTLVYRVDGRLTLVLMRGDHELEEQKLLDNTGGLQVRPAGGEEIHAALGAHPGSLGAVAVSGIPILADEALRGRSNMTTGANDDDWHLRGVVVARDISVDEWHDFRKVLAGEACVQCGSPVRIVRSIEAGHIFKLGTKYSEAMGATVLDADGVNRVIVMGSYGIGVERNVAAIAETHHDDNGLIWPVDVAPFEAVITLIKPDDERSAAVGDDLYRALRRGGIDVVLDDRPGRPGPKFKDAELVGIPFRLTVGPKGLARDEVEFTTRSSGDTELIAVGDIADAVISRVSAARVASRSAP